MSFKSQIWEGLSRLQRTAGWSSQPAGWYQEYDSNPMSLCSHVTSPRGRATQLGTAGCALHQSAVVRDRIPWPRSDLGERHPTPPDI